MTESVECAVIGAGVVGLAVARALAAAGREVVVLEAETAVGTGVSARSSEVIHAGMYYAKDSVKARLCVAGNLMLREYCAAHGVPFRMVGKLIVAGSAEEDAVLADILVRGEANGVPDLHRVSAAEAQAMEPALRCVSALVSASTGIVDSAALMLSLQGEAEAHGAGVALGSPVVAGRAEPGDIVLVVGGAEPTALRCRNVVNCAGLAATRVSAAIGGVPPEAIPSAYLCKGSYFAIGGRQPFSRLVYPVPLAAGLGVHYTVDMGGQGRFGPDVQWTDTEDYVVDPRRAAGFYAAIRRYWPDLADGALMPAYAGIRPKIHAEHQPAADFRISTPLPGYVALYGIESPGLTSALAIAAHVAGLVA